MNHSIGAAGCTAVVVTFNRRDLLRRCLHAVSTQTHTPDRIIVVDNASTDGTGDMLSEEGWLTSNAFQYMPLKLNTGGAGGFSRGVDEAYRQGAKWIWLMDDDCIPEAECLAQLISAAEELRADSVEPGFLASRVIWTDGTPCLMNLPALDAAPHELTSTRITKATSSSFVSMLVNRNAVAAFGLPVAEFFIWFDDVEYSRRISRLMPSYVVSGSIALHMTATNPAPLDFRLIDESSAWKFRFGVRNEMSYSFHQGGLFGALGFFAKVVWRMGRSGKLIKFGRQMLSALRDGVEFDYKSFIRMPTEAQPPTEPACAVTDLATPPSQ